VDEYTLAAMKQRLTIAAGNEQHAVLLERTGEFTYRVTVNDEELVVDARPVGPMAYHVLRGGEAHDVLLERRPTQLVVHHDGVALPLEILDERQLARLAVPDDGVRRGADGRVAIRAPMPGKVVKLLARTGEQVTAGQGIVVIEAMKMENDLRSGVDGTVREIRVTEGANVEAGEILVVIG
jgi:biotin carboxyl carrier protein